METVRRFGLGAVGFGRKKDNGGRSQCAKEERRMNRRGKPVVFALRAFSLLVVAASVMLAFMAAEVCNICLTPAAAADIRVEGLSGTTPQSAINITGASLTKIRAGGDFAPEIPVFINLIFEFGTERIVDADHLPVLDFIAQVLRENPDMRLRITGHTDNVGSEAANLALSERRARAVQQEFVMLGLNGERFEIDCKGESEPIDTNDTEEGRQKNRRIEFTVLE